MYCGCGRSEDLILGRGEYEKTEVMLCDGRGNVSLDTECADARLAIIVWTGWLEDTVQDYQTEVE